MKVNFLKGENNTRVILFFNGWSLDNAVINQLDRANYDIITFNEYDNNFSLGESFLKDYSEINLVAWSMGVWASAKTLRDSSVKINKSIAINGTLKPIDDNNGIPVAIFEGTINNFSERNKKKFDRRMLGSKESFETFENMGVSRSISSQLEELKRIYKNAVNNTIDFTFDKIFIGKQDLIFPTKNQLDFWKGKSKIIEKDMPHFPFFYFKSWDEIING